MTITNQKIYLNTLKRCHSQLYETKFNYTNIDQCINHSQEKDMFPIADLIQGHSVAKRQKLKELKPYTFVKL